MALTVLKVVTGRWRENCYLVYAEDAEALIIDPGADFEKIETCVEDAKLQVTRILLTHGHFDHIGAAAALGKRYGVPCHAHPADHKLIRRANFYRMLFDSKEPIEIPTVEVIPERGTSSMSIAGFGIETIHTPGHTQGGVCFRIGDDLFSGDTFHHGVAGRVDLPGGNADRLAISLQQLRTLPASLCVYPGHGPTTTIGAELDGALTDRRSLP